MNLADCDWDAANRVAKELEERAADLEAQAEALHNEAAVLRALVSLIHLE